MRYSSLLLIAALLSGIFPAQAAAGASSLSEMKLVQLEQRLIEIDAELSQLAQTSLRGGVGSIGYRSSVHQSADHTEWVEIELETEVPVDEIVLVPALFRDSKIGFQSDGFPESFQVVAKSDTNPEGTVIAAYDSSIGILPRTAPLIIPGAGIRASRIRIEVSRLSPRAFDQRFVFQLSEVLVFSGEKNFALRRPVTCPSPPRQKRQESPWDKRFLVDGHTSYLMDAAAGEESLAYLKPLGTQPVVTVDLGASHPVSGIHLHALDQSDTVPQAYAGGYGIPRHLMIEGANLADFSDVVPLLETTTESLTDIGPIMMWNIPETLCRYIRLAEADPTDTSRFGFAEIEIFSNHQNIALGKPVSTDGAQIAFRRPLNKLTDGQNLYGNILPIRAWMQQLARRHDLETERPQVVDELARRYARQKSNLRWMSWITAILIVGSATVIMVEQVIRRRAIARTRERIAANLHDELGANLHAIGLLGDFAKKIVKRKNAQDEWAELTNVIDQVRSLTEETGETARYCTNMLETKGIHANLIEEMKRLTDQLLNDLEYEATFSDDAKSLRHLNPRRRIDLYLFYKECLTNILRHSNATSVSTQLTISEKMINLEITDNGQGIPKQEVPKSLRRRARLLGANVAVESPAAGGTRITLRLRPRGRLWRNRD